MCCCLVWFAKLVPKITTRMCKLNSQKSSDQSCFCTNTRTHTRQNKSYRLGAVPAGVVGARGRCCPAATVPVVLPKKSKIKSSTENQSSAMIVHKAKRTAVTSTRTTHTRHNKPFEAAICPILLVRASYHTVFSCDNNSVFITPHSEQHQLFWWDV